MESAWHPRGFPRWVASSLEKVKRFSAVSSRRNRSTRAAAIRPVESVSFREFVRGHERHGVVGHYRRHRIDGSEILVELARETLMIQTMPMTVEQIVEESRQLQPEQLAELLDRLTVELHETPDPEIDQLWADEAERRLDEIRSGKVKAIPGDEVMARARKIVGL